MEPKYLNNNHVESYTQDVFESEATQSYLRSLASYGDELEVAHEIARLMFTVDILFHELNNTKALLDECETKRHSLSDAYRRLQESLADSQEHNDRLSRDILSMQTVNDGLKSLIKGLVIFL